MNIAPIHTGSAPAHVSTSSAPTVDRAVPRPPARWAQWWTSPIARFDYAPGGLASAWHEAWIPADRGLTGDLKPSVVFGGSSREAAIEAARRLASRTVSVDMDLADGSTRTVQVNPAIAVLHDAVAGAYWLASLRTTVRSHGEWVDAPHSVDGAAFEGAQPILRTPKVRSATNDMVAVVGHTVTIRPTAWKGAPDDLQLDRA